MAAPNSTTAKLSVLVSPATKRGLEKEARARNTTVGAIVPERLAGTPDEDEQAFMEALVALGDRARAVVARIDEGWKASQRQRAEWPQTAARVRAEALAKLTDRDREALVGIVVAPSVAQP